MKKKVFFGCLMAGIVAFGSSCGNKQQAAASDEDTTSTEELVPTDKTVYGICTSSADSKMLLLLADSGDTLKLDMTPAIEADKVLGGLQVSDRLAVVADKKQKLALQVINLNTLMGDWVMPDPIDGSTEVGIRIKEGGVAESIDQSVIIYRTWRIFNGYLDIQLVREGGGDEQEDNRYEILKLGADTLAYRTVGKPRDETDTFEYNRHKPKPKLDLKGLELEDTNDEFNKI